jgi:AraC family transcriptional regulator, exoenzyme S synthesis regulatory protein ExsA
LFIPTFGAMLYRFPPTPAEAAQDGSFLTGRAEVFAKLKREQKPGQRTVLMTEHTLIFVLKGMKLLHLPDQTVTASPGDVVLLRKGIYVMAEYIEEGMDFEAMMVFLPAKLLQGLAQHGRKGHSPTDDHCVVFPATGWIDGFKEGFYKFFEQRPAHVDQLLSLKQQEILLLLLSGPYGAKVQEFIYAAASQEPGDIDFIVRQYLLQPVTIAELAALSNCSLAKFKRDFQQRYHCAPRTWINQQRLRHACMLVENTDQSVAAIADACGFDNASYFIRLFKTEYGSTPAAWRAKIAIG